MLLEGARCAERVGLGRACFSVRILELFSATNANQRANFLLGAVLATDLIALKNSSALRWSPDTPIVITGRRVMKQALQTLVHEDSSFRGEIIADRRSYDGGHGRHRGHGDRSRARPVSTAVNARRLLMPQMLASTLFLPTLPEQWQPVSNIIRVLRNFFEVQVGAQPRGFRRLDKPVFHLHGIGQQLFLPRAH